MIWGLALKALSYVLTFVRGRAADAKNAAIEQGKLNVERDRIKSRVLTTAMNHKAFWFAWSLFAVPLGAWWALVMIDSMIPAHVLNLQIPDLPQSVRPWADKIFDNLFYSGTAVGSVQIASRGVVSYMNGRQQREIDPVTGERM